MGVRGIHYAPIRQHKSAIDWRRLLFFHQTYTSKLQSELRREVKIGIWQILSCSGFLPSTVF